MQLPMGWGCWGRKEFCYKPLEREGGKFWILYWEEGEGDSYGLYVCISEFCYVYYLRSLNYKHLEELYSSYHLAHPIIVEEYMLKWEQSKIDDHSVIDTYGKSYWDIHGH